jgi:cytochrome c oxidase subunit IV
VAKPVANLLFVIAMAAVIVAVDLFVFRHHFWERLAANVGIVLVFVAFYFRFVRHS